MIALPRYAKWDLPRHTTLGAPGRRGFCVWTRRRQIHSHVSAVLVPRFSGCCVQMLIRLVILRAPDTYRTRVHKPAASPLSAA